MNKKPYIILATPAPITNATSEENLGLGYLASVCRKRGIEVEILDGWMRGLTPKEIVEIIINKKEKPMLVGFSCYLLNKDIVLDIVNRLHRLNYNVPLIAGGFGPTFAPEAFLEGGFDIVSFCEGEKCILDLCQHFLTGVPELKDIKGIFYKREGEIMSNSGALIQNLDDLPFPERDTMQIAINSNTPVDVLSSRGCTGACTFCSVAAFWRKSQGDRYRTRSISNVVDEIENIYNQGAWFLKFVDDSFIDGERAEEWCHKFKEEILRRDIHILFRVSMRSNKLTEGILKSLCECGLVSLQLGIENFSDEALKRMGKRADRENNIAALELVNKYRKKYGLCLQMGFILFDYNTTFTEVELNFKYLKEYSWAITRGFTEMYAAVGTPYTKKLIDLEVAKPISYGNYGYEIKDEKVRRVYDALKRWHIHYLALYDKIIDPVTKPRAMKKEGLLEFSELYKCIKTKELEFFENILELVREETEQSRIEDYIVQSIENSEGWIENLTQRTEELYQKNRLVYNASKNPFIKTTGSGSCSEGK